MCRGLAKKPSALNWEALFFIKLSNMFIPCVGLEKMLQTHSIGAKKKIKKAYLFMLLVQFLMIYPLFFLMVTVTNSFNNLWAVRLD